MPTTKPRVQVTLDEQTHEVIDRMAAIQKRSRGAIIAELLKEVSPALARTVALLEAAAAAPEQVRSGLRSVVEDIHDELLAVSGDGIQQMDWLMSELRGDGASGDGQAAHPRAARPPITKPLSGDTNPHVVTRGSGMDYTPPRKPTKPRSKGSKTGITGQPPTQPPTDSEYRSAIKAAVAEKRGRKDG